MTTLPCALLCVPILARRSVRSTLNNPPRAGARQACQIGRRQADMHANACLLPEAGHACICMSDMTLVMSSVEASDPEVGRNYQNLGFF